jgi:ubiquitin-like 1-activating enzyme E1 B
LDTIDVSNLNRQFLFQKQHVGKSKSLIAKESVLKLTHAGREVSIDARMCSIFLPEFSVPWIKQFSIILNALDNVSARNHVNRLALAADIPLVESGTAGYSGESSVIKKGLSPCYECSVRSRWINPHF